MARQTIASEVHWHALRAKHVGASEVAALFGCGYQTHFQLWHEKRGDLEHEDFRDNERVILGRCLESGIASAAQQLYGLDLVKADCYITDDTTPGLGSTPDYFTQQDGIQIPVEVKNASWGQWKDNWIIHEDGSVEPPLRYLLQVQTQLACTGANRAILVALISGDRVVRCDIEWHGDAIDEIRRRVREFWASIANDEEPPADFGRDGDAMRQVWTAGEGSIDLTGDPDIEHELETLAELRDGKRRFEGDIDVLEDRLLKYCVDNRYASVRCNAGRISVKNRPAKSARMVEYRAQPAKIEMRVTTVKP